MQPVCAIILTFNEKRHIARAIESAREVCEAIYVIDSFSSDGTTEIARSLGAHVVSHTFISQADQFAWALSIVPEHYEWILRLDADEVLTPELSRRLRREITDASPITAGFTLNRCIVFQGRLLRHGGLLPSPVLRVFRRTKGKVEDQWMDEHIRVVGHVVDLPEQLVDHNLNTLSWWIAKHNRYASRQAADTLHRKYGPNETEAGNHPSQGDGTYFKLSSHTARRRRLKLAYETAPPFWRALSYFIYRYFLRGGFLDGRAGLLFHVLQAGWYRFLVDAKIWEVERYLSEHQCSLDTAIEAVLDVKGSAANRYNP